MEHTIPNTPLGVLKAILRALILAADPDSTFVDAVEPEDQAPATWEDGHRG